MTPQQIVDLLNEAFTLDPGAMHALVANRVPCNQKLGAHPTIQVEARQKAFFSVGMLGILNGLAMKEHETIEILFSGDEPPQFMGFRLKPTPMCKPTVEEVKAMTTEQRAKLLSDALIASMKEGNENQLKRAWNESCQLSDVKPYENSCILELVGVVSKLLAG